MAIAINDSQWKSALDRYQAGEWRARIFCDLVIADAVAKKNGGSKPAMLDIGCGKGFDVDQRLSAELATHAGEMIGIEPDPDIKLAPFFTSAHCALLETAPIEPGSIDVAYAVMVLEHVENPTAFWGRLHQLLKPGGVFWGFTVDARHWFAFASNTANRLQLKSLYLKWLRGERGVDRYENYPVHYRTNRPNDVATYTKDFNRVDLLNFTKVGQVDYFLPKLMQPVSHLVDRAIIKTGLPGSVLAVRVQK